MKLDRIDYNGGEIWVDKEAKIKVGDTYVLIATDGIDEPTYLIRVLESNYKPFGFKVVAQSITNPSYIDGVPFVEVGEESVEDKARLMMMNYLTDGNPNGDFKKSTIGADENIRWWIKGYKAAQAKQFLQHPERYFPQQKQLPFNTAYCDEVLVNHLRRRPDLLKEIIQVQL